MSVWTDEKCDLLTQLWPEGWSSAQISEKLGGGFTRNAIIGKAHRLGLSSPNGRPNGGRKKRGDSGGGVVTSIRSKISAPRSKLVKVKKPMSVSVPATPHDVPDNQIPRDQLKTLMELTDTSCRWPVDFTEDGMFLFCGHPSASMVECRPYCKVHTKRAFVKSSSRSTPSYTLPRR